MPLVPPKPLKGLYIFLKALAEGSFGTLYVAVHAITRRKVAIKILDKTKLGTETFRVRCEIEALKQLHHRHIYKLYQVVETKYCFYLVLEYVSGGELFDYILQKEFLSESEARTIFRQIVSAVGFAHSKGFYHRDLKPENILLDNKRNVRLIDFGLCAKKRTDALLDTFCGSLAYAAPEILANQEYSGGAADIWSLGVILYTLLCGCLPFDPNKPLDLSPKDWFKVPENLSKSSVALLSKLMCVDPEKRIKMEELRKHPWMVDGPVDEPVNFEEEESPMHHLNKEILEEISRYIGLPPCETARMLQRRSYDYLMATYMIMKTAFVEENVTITLPNRIPRPVSSEHTSPSRTKSDSPVLVRSKSVVRPSDAVEAGPSRHSGSHSAIDQLLPACSPREDERRSISLRGSELSMGTESTDENTNPADPDGRDARSESTVLSPSRSMDSQLSRLDKGLHEIQLTHMPSSNRSDTDSDKFGSRLFPDSADEDGNSGSTPHGRHQFTRLVDAFKQPKAHKGTPEYYISDSRLRKTRLSNNVFLVRQGLEGIQVLQRIASTLRQHSIRFNLKGSGFECTITNDWGKTVLSFVLELVSVHTKSAEPGNTTTVKRRMTLKPRPSIAAPALLLSDSRTSACSCGDHSEPQSNSSSVTQYHVKPQTDSHRLGIKIKRLRGDSYMYASLCRTILTMADIRDT